ncbi:hypothetical protein DYY67_0170 [Candidatus Nitrosotalea sp. TS]|nr:hypothetical protein [Candidatus Nitrosotalea sp. TS]
MEELVFRNLFSSIKNQSFSTFFFVACNTINSESKHEKQNQFPMIWVLGSGITNSHTVY